MAGLPVLAGGAAPITISTPSPNFLLINSIKFAVAVSEKAAFGLLPPVKTATKLTGLSGLIFESLWIVLFVFSPVLKFLITS